MDNPFLPALICFGPFFAILLFHVLTRRRQEPKSVPPSQIAVFIIIALGIGIAGTAASYLLFT